MDHPAPFASCTPETAGISSSILLAWLAAAAQKKLTLHSFILIRHGKMVAEAYWQPYARECKRYVYSLSKSFTSTAIGLAAMEGLLRLNDSVISFFPDEKPELITENLAAMTVKDLLSMCSGHDKDTTVAIFEPGFSSWAQAILSLPVERKPGSLFIYNSGASYLLSAIVQKVSGQTLTAYLEPRLFAPLSIADYTWDSCPSGINTGGWGLSIRPIDVAKFGLLYLQKGVWNGAQLLSSAWVEEATSAVVRNDGEGREKDPPDWKQGYGYQFWRCQHNAYRGDGAFGQYCLVMPDQDAVLVITSETPDMQSVLDSIWEILLPAMQPSALPENPEAYAQLAAELAALRLPLPQGVDGPGNIAELSGKTFTFEENRTGLRSLRLTFSPETTSMHLQDERQLHHLVIGNGNWQTNLSALPCLIPSLLQLGVRQITQEPLKLAASGSWTSTDVFQITCQFLETPHSQTISFKFANDLATMQISSALLEGGHPLANGVETTFIGK